jgi:hypothetical protein
MKLPADESSLEDQCLETVYPSQYLAHSTVIVSCISSVEEFLALSRAGILVALL